MPRPTEQDDIDRIGAISRRFDMWVAVAKDDAGWRSDCAFLLRIVKDRDATIAQLRDQLVPPEEERKAAE